MKAFFLQISKKICENFGILATLYAAETGKIDAPSSGQNCNTKSLPIENDGPVSYEEMVSAWKAAGLMVKALEAFRELVEAVKEAAGVLLDDVVLLVERRPVE